MESYLALFEPDLKAGGYVVTFPDFGCGVTQGETDAEAMEMAQDLLMLTVGEYSRDSKSLPTAKTLQRNEIFAPYCYQLCRPRRSIYTPPFLRRVSKRRNSPASIGIPRTHVERLFSIRHQSRLDRIEAAFAVLGKCLHIEARDAA